MSSRLLSSLNPLATIYLQDTKQNAKSQKGKGNKSTQRDCSTFRYLLTFRDFSIFRDFWTPVTCRALQQQSSRIVPNVAFAPTNRERIWRSNHAAPMTFKKRRPPKGPGRDLLAGDSFYHRNFSTFRDFATFRKMCGEQVDPANTFN